MKIKEIFDEIAATGGNNAKMDVLKKYSDNELLRRVLYMANSKRVKFYIKRLPEYTHNEVSYTLEQALGMLMEIANRDITGQNAIDKLTIWLENVSADDAYIIERIIDKDCKIGMGTTFINKVFKGLIEETPYMGAVSFDEKKARKIFDKGAKGISQVKMDGRYCNAVIRGGDVELESRQGEPTILTGAKFLEELSNFEDCVLNGELTMDGVPRYESNGIIASLIDISKNKGIRSDAETERKITNFEDKHGSFTGALESIRYTVWDTITVDEYFAKESSTPYKERLETAASYIYVAKPTMVRIIESKEVNSYAEAMEHFQEVLASEVNGVPQEGTILKDSNGTWKDGKPSWQIKLKIEMNVDLKIVGFNYGTKGTKNENVISSLVCESSCGKLKTRPQGLKEDLMIEITENQENLLGTIIEVKCSGLSFDNTGAYSLLYPAFKHFRDDKSEANSLDECIEIQNAAIGLTV